MLVLFDLPWKLGEAQYMSVEMEESVVGKKQDDMLDTSICQRYCFIIHPKILTLNGRKSCR